MNIISRKAKRNAWAVSFVHIALWIIFATLRQLDWGAFLALSVFLLVWTLILFWITFSWSKRFFNNRAIYLPSSIKKNSLEYLERKSKWKDYLFWKTSEYVKYFALANAAMCIILYLEFLDGEQSLRLVVVYGILSLLSFFIFGWMKFRIRPLQE